MKIIKLILKIIFLPILWLIVFPYAMHDKPEHLFDYKKEYEKEVA